MSNWSRRHDAWLARECEGLEVWVNAGDGAICDFQDNSIPHYLTDPAAAIRAAEAWACRKYDRGYSIHRAPSNTMLTKAFMAVVDNGQVATYFHDTKPESALAQALYRATGGPA